MAAVSRSAVQTRARTNPAFMTDSRCQIYEIVSCIIQENRAMMTMFRAKPKVYPTADTTYVVPAGSTERAAVHSAEAVRGMADSPAIRTTSPDFRNSSGLSTSRCVSVTPLWISTSLPRLRPSFTVRSATV
jgi:hypothetical protein